jgi:FtsP/CotA-like multicopper oxidase with cupredoxin domain
VERVPGITQPVNEKPAGPDDLFTTDTTGLSDAARPQVVRLHDGDRFDLRIEPVRKQLGGSELRMLGYNGSIPGPVLHVDQGSEITVEVANHGDVEATVHWHGLRLENRYDGVPHDTQAPIPIGGTFTYKVQFPDAGFYWYHPHVREDFGLEMGLYGTIIVEPADPSYWPPSTVSSASPSTTCSSRTATSRRSVVRAPTTPRWEGSAT